MYMYLSLLTSRNFPKGDNLGYSRKREEGGCTDNTGNQNFKGGKRGGENVTKYNVHVLQEHF